MSPGIGMPELLVVLVLALVVVGPQQLPVMMRKVGQMMAQARAMAKDFQNSFEEIGRETELSELRREIDALKQANPINQIHGELDKTAREAQGDEIRALKLKHMKANQVASEAAPMAEPTVSEPVETGSVDTSEATPEEAPVASPPADTIKGR